MTRINLTDFFKWTIKEVTEVTPDFGIVKSSNVTVIDLLPMRMASFILTIEETF